MIRSLLFKSFFLTWGLMQAYANHAFWAAMLVFMAVRPIVLSTRLRFLVC